MGMQQDRPAEMFKIQRIGYQGFETRCPFVRYVKYLDKKSPALTYRKVVKKRGLTDNADR
jgi:hypothetical protein